MSKIIINGKSEGSLKAYVNGSEVNGIEAGGSRGYTRVTTGAEPVPPAPARDYLRLYTLNSQYQMHLYISVSGAGYDPGLEYSTDKVNWTPIPITSTSTISIRLPNNSKGCYLRSSQPLAKGKSSYSRRIIKPYLSTNYRISGHIASIIDYTQMETMTVIPDYALYNVFSGVSALTSASELSFDGITTVGAHSCEGMFKNCTNIASGPRTLPDATIGESCYYEMFRGCTSLRTAPELPSKTLASSCYSNMFYGCTDLLYAPTELPATTLANSCYYNMFRGCTSLKTAPPISATTMAEFCCQQMYYGCSSLTTAPSITQTMAFNCCASMFANCTSLTTAPALTTITLAGSCYSGMFEGCTSLTTAPALNAMALPDQCYYYMFKDCTSLTTAPKLPATTITGSGCYQGMFRGCTSLTTIACAALYVQYMADNWTDGVAANGTFYKNQFELNWPTGSNGIPNGWTVGNYNDYQG